VKEAAPLAAIITGFSLSTAFGWGFYGSIASSISISISTENSSRRLKTMATGSGTWRQFQINGNCLAALCNFHAVFHGSVKMSNNNGIEKEKRKATELSLAAPGVVKT